MILRIVWHWFRPRFNGSKVCKAYNQKIYVLDNQPEAENYQYVTMKIRFNYNHKIKANVLRKTYVELESELQSQDIKIQLKDKTATSPPHC